MVNKRSNMVKKSEYFLIRIFWIGRDLPHPFLTESKKKQVFLTPPLIIWEGVLLKHRCKEQIPGEGKGFFYCTS